MIAPQSNRLVVRVVVVLLFLGGGIMLFRSWEQSHPDYPYFQAQAAKSRGDIEAARLHLLTLLEQSPDHAEGHALLSRLYLDEAKATEGEASRIAQSKALDQLARAAELRPDDLALQSTLLRAYIDTDQWKPAAALATTLEKIDPQNADALLTLSRVALDAERFDEGEQWLMKLLAEPPDPSFATRALEVRLYRSTKRSELLQQSLKATLAQSTAGSLDQLASLNRRERKMMYRLLELSVDLSPDIATAHARTAETLLVYERLASATKDKSQVPAIAESACRLLVILEKVHPLDPKATADKAARDQLCLQPQPLRIAAIESGKASILVYRQAASAALLQGDDAQALKWTKEAIPAAEKSRQTNGRNLSDLQQIATQIEVNERANAQAGN
jgi:tetratricopeptide (TPR) repeat protein